MEHWLAIPDEGRCTPLLTTKYEPDVVKTDRDIEVGNRMDKKTRCFAFWDCQRPPGDRNLAVAILIKFGT